MKGPRLQAGRKDCMNTQAAMGERTEQWRLPVSTEGQPEKQGHLPGGGGGVALCGRIGGVAKRGRWTRRQEEAGMDMVIWGTWGGPRGDTGACRGKHKMKSVRERGVDTEASVSTSITCV